MKCKNLFSGKNKKNILICCLLKIYPIFVFRFIILYTFKSLQKSNDGSLVRVHYFGSEGPRFKPRWRQNSAHDFTVLHCTEPHYHTSIILT